MMNQIKKLENNYQIRVLEAKEFFELRKALTEDPFE
jgi:hypothetical protein